MNVRSNALRATTALTVIAALFLATPASFADSKSSKSSKESSKEATKESSKESTKKVETSKATKSMCAKTTAVAHKPINAKIPTITTPVKNRIFTFTTNCGDIVVETDGSATPLTVTAIASLVSSGWYTKSLCHRLTTAGIFVIQCGDPTATGSGGPQWRYPDENLPDSTTNNYPEGIVAMANSGQNTNGSQFFFVYANTTLGPSYTRWGKIIKGLDILKYVAAQGVVGGAADGTPKQTFAIEKVTVSYK